MATTKLVYAEGHSISLNCMTDVKNKEIMEVVFPRKPFEDAYEGNLDQIELNTPVVITIDGKLSAEENFKLINVEFSERASAIVKAAFTEKNPIILSEDSFEIFGKKE